METYNIENKNLPQIIQDCGAVSTLPEILNRKLPSIALLKKNFEQPRISAAIQLQILDVLEFFNLKSSMNERQITQTADLILDSYYWITLSDISLCFKQAKLGEYGKLYAAIDGQVILLWFKVYTADRASQAEDLAENEHSERKTQKVKFAPEIIEAIKQVDTITEVKKVVESAVKNSLISDLEVQGFDLFDKLHKAQKYPMLSSFRIARYGGRNYTQSNFVQTFVFVCRYKRF